MLLLLWGLMMLQRLMMLVQWVRYGRSEFPPPSPVSDTDGRRHQPSIVVVSSLHT